MTCKKNCFDMFAGYKESDIFRTEGETIIYDDDDEDDVVTKAVNLLSIYTRLDVLVLWVKGKGYTKKDDIIRDVFDDTCEG